MDTRSESTDRAWPVPVPSSLRRRGLQLSERKILLFVADLGIGTAVLTVWLGWRFGLQFGWTAAVSHPAWYLAWVGVWTGCAVLLDVYNLRRAARLRSGAIMGAGVALAASLAYLALPRFTPPLPASRVEFFEFPALLVAGVVVWRMIYTLTLVRPQFRQKALIVGAGWSGRTIARVIQAAAGSAYDIVGFVDDDPAKQDAVIDGLRVLGTRADLSRLLQQTDASEMIVAITQPDRMHPELFQAIMDCHERGTYITEMAALFEQLTGRVPVEHAGRNLHYVLPLSAHPSRVQQFAKWLFDFAVGIAGLTATILLMPFVWLALIVESRGPIFYRQVRVGLGGRPFELIKFRTMVPDAEGNGPQWAAEGDRRVTRVGRVLRKLHIDEIPQAINILRGELSFIGPRPERPEFVAQLEKEIPFYRARHAVRPGVTGWAQVNYAYAASVQDALIKLQYDLFYIKHQSLWLDIVILARTVGLVLTLRGR